MDLFDENERATSGRYSPLAERMRPQSLDDVAGQDHLLGPGKPLRLLIESDAVPSLILWGPPGSGKTTIARLVARRTSAEFHQLNAVSSGVREVRAVLERAAENRRYHGRSTILFIDEVHRFNKAQQDALLHSVEEGLVILIGATTENPSFEVIPPLLSRCRVYVLQSLEARHLRQIAERALATDAVLTRDRVLLEDMDALIALSGGDARTLLNGLETAVRLAPRRPGAPVRLTAAEFEEVFQRRHVRYDAGGEEHYNVISACIKSIRGSDPDASVYWLARMLEGGEDPLFIARRLLILAAEDIGNAEPRALPLALAAFQAVHALGLPEARIVLSQAALFLASCPKSNAAITSIDSALRDARETSALPVPLHLRNAPTPLMKSEGYGRNYRYPHDSAEGFVPQEYFPPELSGRVYYRPAPHGQERDIAALLATLWPDRRR